jgi:predicted Zn-dependent protease
MAAMKPGKLLALVGALAALALSACGDTSEGDSGSSTPRGHKARRGDPTPATAAPTCGWIPPDATEATPVASLHADRAEDPLCADTASALDVPKAIAASLEKELREATKMSDEDEARIGARLESGLLRERSFRGKFDLPEDVQRYGGYLRDIVKNLAGHTTRPAIPWHIHLVRLPVFNAAALPGGTIVVFTGTLEGREAVRDEAELAGVLGHEMTHVERRHVVAAYQFARAALGEDSDEAALAMRVLTQPISTEHELEADDRGMELATLAQYDPKAVVNLWRRRARTEHPQRRRGRGVVGDVIDGVDALLRSHPPAAVRACHAMDKLAWAEAHAPCDRVYDGRTNLLQRVAGPRRPY